MNAILKRRLERLEARRAGIELSDLSDAQLAELIRDGWDTAFAHEGVDDDFAETLRATARSFDLEPMEGEAPDDLWSRLRPLVDAASDPKL